MAFVYLVGIPSRSRAVDCFQHDRLPGRMTAIYDRWERAWIATAPDFIEEKAPRPRGEATLIPPLEINDFQLEELAQAMLQQAALAPNDPDPDLTWNNEVTLDGFHLLVSDPEFVGVVPVWPDGRRGIALLNHNSVLMC